MYLDVIDRDYDDNLPSDVVDSFVIDLESPQAGTETPATNYVGRFGVANITLSFRVTCLGGFTGDDCARICQNNAVCLENEICEGGSDGISRCVAHTTTDTETSGTPASVSTETETRSTPASVNTNPPTATTNQDTGGFSSSVASNNGGTTDTNNNNNNDNNNNNNNNTITASSNAGNSAATVAGAVTGGIVALTIVTAALASLSVLLFRRQKANPAPAKGIQHQPIIPSFIFVNTGDEEVGGRSVENPLYGDTDQKGREAAAREDEREVDNPIYNLSEEEFVPDQIIYDTITQ